MRKDSEKLCQCSLNERCPKCDRRVKHAGEEATWEAYVERRRAYQRAYSHRRRLARKEKG